MEKFITIFAREQKDKRRVEKRMKSKNSQMKKVTAFLLSLALIVGTVPSSFLTAFASDDANAMGELSAISDGAVITDANGENATAMYGSEAMVLNWSPADASIGRMSNGWWIGVKMTAPANMTTESDFENVAYQTGKADGWSESKSFWQYKDSASDATEHYITLWGKLDEQILNDSLSDKDSEDTIDYKWQFDWNKDGAFEQLVTIKIVPDKIVLNKEGSQVYPSVDGNGTVSTLSDGLAVQGDSNANVVKVVYETEQILNWVQADASIGRVSDGWWAGIKITAPSNMTQESDFANVTYQSCGSSSWSDARLVWADKDSADEATEHYITLWGLLNETKLLNAKEKNTTIQYKMRIDWDADGVYEQIVILEIDPDKIILNDKDGYQIYPALGTVSAFTNGTVSGSGTENTVVQFADVALNWSPKDESIGRMQDGWWTGVKVTAPADMTAEELEKAFYNKTIYNSETKKVFFKDVRDSETHVELWTRLDRDMLEENIDKEIVHTYVFDWDGDGVDDQKLTISIDCDTITLNRVACTDFTFADVSTDKKVWVGDEIYTNVASSQLSSGAVSYEIDATSTPGAATVDANTGKITLQSVGTVKVNATIAQDDVYNSATTSFTFEIVKKQPTGFSISQPADVTYGNNDNVFENTAVDGEGNGTIEYTIVNQTGLEGEKVDSSMPVAIINKTTGTLEIKRSGKITVNAIRLEDSKYEEVIATYTLTIKKAEQQGFNFTVATPTELTYSTTPYDSIKVEGGQVDTEDIVYTITSGTDVAKVVEGNKIQTLKSGDFTLSVTKAGNDCYNPVTITRDMKVNLAPQTTFKFTTEAPKNITYNENNNLYSDNPAIGGESTGAVTYEIVMGDATSLQDTNNHVLTIKKAGEVTVKATKAADDKYQEATAQYTITIDLAKQAFTFADGAEILKFYGIKEYMNAPVPTVDESKADKIGHGTGDFVYTIENNNIGATIPDEKTGKVVFGDSEQKVGTVTVNVTRLADEKYAECSNSYTIRVEYTDAPSPSYTIDEKINANGWYKHDLTITAPDGYLISYNNELSTADWAESVTFASENMEIPSIALKNIEKGDITPKISINGKLDKTEPINLSIEYKTPLWIKIAEVMFGFDAESVDVSFKAEDTYSGIDFIEFSLDGGKTWEDKITDFNGEYTHTIDVQYRDSIALRVTDKAGNVSKIEHNEVVVVDKVTPTINFDYDYHTGLHQEVDNIIYVNKKVTVEINLEAANFDLSERPIVKVNGVAKTLNWETNANLNSASFDLDETGDYVIKAQFVDRLGRNTEVEKEIHVDLENPDLYDFTFEDGDIKGTDNNRDYYDEAQIVTAVIKEHNFRASDVVLTVTADQATVDCNKYKNDFAVSSAWTETEEDVWTAKIPFTKDANYTLNLTYTDLAGNSKTTDTIAFTVDTTAPAQPKIQYNKTWFASVVEGLTFGFFKAPIEVTVTSSDAVAGVKEIAYGYVGTKGEYVKDSIEVADTKATSAGSITFTIPENTEFKGIVSATAYDWSMNASSVQNVAYDADNNVVGGIVVDNISPEVEVKFEGSLKDQIDVDTDSDITRQKKTTTDEETRFVYDGDITATIIVKEANFYEDMEITVYRDGTEVAASEYVITGWKTTSEEDTFVNILTFSKDGDYQLELNYKDKSTNAMKYDASGEYEGKTETNETYVSNIHTIDTVTPVYEVTYDNNTVTQTIDGREYYDGNRTATIAVTDRNFRPNEVKFKVEANDVKEEDVAFTYSTLTAWSDWKQDATDKNKWIATVPFTTDANYTVDFTYTDIAGHTVENDYQKLFTVDKLAPAELNVSYSTNIVDKILSTIFFYNTKATVTLSASDATAGIEIFTLDVKKDGLSEATDIELPTNLVINADGTVKSGTKGFIKEITSVAKDGKVELSFEVPEQFRGEFVLTSVTDLSHNESATYDDTEVVVVDTVSPKVDVKFEGSLKDEIDVDTQSSITRQTKDKTDATTRFVYNGDITATITVKEANFYEDMVITVYRDGAEIASTDYASTGWKTTTVSGVNENVLTFSEDGDYQLKLDYEDKSDNKMDYDASGEYEGKTEEKAGTYTSNIHTLDTVKPEYEITYDNNTVIKTVDERDYFDANRTATITVTDRNFRPNEVTFTVEAKDVSNDDVTFAYSNLKSWSDWQQDATDKNKWTATVPFTTDANYTVDFTYTDIAGHAVKEAYQKLFTVDKVAPENLDISYEPTFVGKIIEGITFGFYKAPVKVTITATDETSGIDKFVYSYKKAVDASVIDKELLGQEIDYATKEHKATVSFMIPKDALSKDNQFNGNVSFEVYDRSNNVEDTADTKRVVVDSVSPEISVSYVAKDTATKVQFVDAQTDTVSNFENATQAFYNGAVTTTITINEANFFEGKEAPKSENGIVHEVGILLTKTDNNGVTTKTEYLPQGSAQKYATETTDVKYFTWTSDKDINTFTIDYVDDADYVLTVEYADFSTNDSNIAANDGQTVTKKYESKVVTVDNINPEVKVEYSNQNVINKVDGRDYLNAKQVATITVTEHNFRADDVDVDVIAQNIIGEDVAVTDFDAQLRDRGYWKHYDANGNEVEKAVDGNVHVATITYDVDANYTFDIKYTDLALREYDSYETDYFTVDTTAPTNLKASYSTSILQKVIESITFGYYDAQMTVTIQADDETASIYHYKYSYLKSKNVSSVNAELINQAIDNAKITREGKTSTTIFHIPERVLQSDNQFNGTIEFTAYDRSENSTEKKDNVRVVVDNITPTAQVTYNEPVKNANGISYYAGDINGTIVINEANFYSEDVEVVVTRDGNAVPVAITWVDNSVDQHTGTFTLHDDGDYIVTINYADRSSNKMTTYTSNELTVDTVKPSVSVSNIKMNSANKDETYGFTITANDINFDAATFKPVLKAVVRGEDGSYETKTISLGDMAGSQDGQTYSYTVKNLEEDGIYTLTCAVKDMSDNAYANIRLEDGKEYETVQFSINRDGSTFGINEYTEEVIEQYYIYSIDKDIVLVEINADPITNYSVIVNGKVLESSEYTTTMDGGDNEWYKRTYTISKELFEKEGEYSIVVRSTDKADTEAYSDVKNIKVAFVVDQTAPVLTISGLEAEGRYQTSEQTVTVIPTDDGGRLYSFKAIVYDDDGNPLKDENGKDISVRFEMEGEELLKYLEEHDGKITFTVPEGYQNNVQIICTDCAKNSEGSANAFDETFEKVTVSASQLVIFYANKPLFYGTVAGLIAIIGGIVFVVCKKRKKEEK